MRKHIIISSTIAGACLMGAIFLAPSQDEPLINNDPIQEVINENKEHLPLPPIHIEKKLVLKKQQTLSDLLRDESIPPALTAKALYYLQKKYNVKQLRPGQSITVSFSENPDNSLELRNLSFFGPDDKSVNISREEGDNFKINIANRLLQTEEVAITGTINDSLYASAKDAGLPTALVPAFANLFAWELDFTRDIRPGATFKVVYEKVLDEKSNYLRSGHILAAELTTRGKTYDAFRTIDNGWAEYFSSKGYNKKRTLLRTPLEFSRISSRFNLKRKHPILGYTRAHKGTDFAAPRGTPVKAAGDGVVEKASWYGGYGRYIRIRHDKTFKTAYAHLTRFAKGIRAGKKVKQGQTIGYVGTTGRSTGPHLHYEVLRYGRHVNPMTVKLPTSKTVLKKNVKEFNAMVAKYQNMWTNTDLARLQKNSVQ